MGASNLARQIFLSCALSAVLGCSGTAPDMPQANEIAVPPMSERQRKIEAFKNLMAENQRLIDELRNRGIDVRDTERGVVVNLPDVLFTPGKAELTQDAVTTVGVIADIVKRAPARRLSVEGHTDDVGTIDYNYRLSLARSDRVAQELEVAGVGRDRISPHALGETTPIATNRTEEGRMRNRRVEIIIENQADL